MTLVSDILQSIPYLTVNNNKTIIQMSLTVANNKTQGVTDNPPHPR